MSSGRERLATAPQTGEDRERIFDAFRRWGYLAANLDPLGFLHPFAHPEIAVSGEIADQARRIYCGTTGAEFMHSADAKRCRWVAERVERDVVGLDRPGGPAARQSWVLGRLIRTELFEQVLQARYVGTKRYSLEGLAALIPLLDSILEAGAAAGAEQVILAMSHRGRLNVMVHIVCRPTEEIFAEFEDVDPRSVLGSGDVKYHVGATGRYRTASGRTLDVHLVSNPSHLEAVDPVAMGRTRAKQARIGPDGSRRVLPIVVHGDAAFAGQGIWAETLNLAGLAAYGVSGTIHIIANNLLGFTTPPAELHTSRFASGLANRQGVPVFHVNGEDPDAVLRAGELALDYRTKFADDVVVDLIGFRRHGHSEVDDPTVTQPLLYAKIKEHPPLWQIYAQRLGADPAAEVAQARGEFEQALATAAKITRHPVLHELPDYWSPYMRGRYQPEFEVDTGVDAAALGDVAAGLTRYPADFGIHPKVKRLLEQRLEMGRGARPVDYGMAEALAFGTLLLSGTPVRLTGQDTVRGTFSQRHAALIDTRNEAEYVPLAHLAPGQARCEIYNSPLSEAGILGYEYGYSRDYPEALVLWEAQFGDFANGAQVIIDQFISAAEDKWDLPSGVALLLPHGYEGQGPEHSSARIERFLQLAAEDNIQVCQPSSAAQYFHLLRRQALRRWRKPLIAFMPKGMLRNPVAASPLADFTKQGQPRFLNVVPEREVTSAKRILICSGKIAHELRSERSRRGIADAAIVTLDQLYPFPADELETALARHPEAREIVWVQEEPANMGALFYAVPQIAPVGGGRPVRSVKRSASASPATGSAKAHELEQKTLLTLALTTGEN
jgi:2-oxoglutarate dehydrogenase E1 component